MHSVLVWGHMGLMMVAFGASPLARLSLRYILSKTSRGSAPGLARAFSGMFLLGGVCVSLGVGVGLALALVGGLMGQTWVIASIALITMAGLANFAIEDRWLKTLSQADGDAGVAIRGERTAFLAALASPVIWLLVLWLMVERPA